MSLPQALHLSATLALVRSKPKHLTIQTLRASIETIHHEGQTLRHLNHSALWQKQHDSLHKVLGKEQDAMFVLQKENEALQAQITQLSARSKPGRKRKMAEQEEPETVKKIKAASIAIAEFGSAADVDPGLDSLRHVNFNADPF
ncbi:unnamed protein product [Aureobasidium uvarum]|uniref:Uncharacterized protein n=1 Tax=Aureobasidium uvarum TaxID=2773716 RepID=A0A9N8KAG4_9PEZI|nr:unnamed protein product [Aureobasidium uvarum]